MKKIFINLLLIVSVLMSMFTVSASFSDVADGYAHTVAIETLTQLGVIGGYPDGTYQPDKNVTRGEMAALVYRLATTFANVDQKDTIFSDVAADNWASGYITWCNAKAIVGGYPTGDFKPENNVSYDEALKMVCATLGYTDFDSALWPTDVRQKALKDLKLGAELEDVAGADKLTRGQVAQLLYNALTVDMNQTKIGYVYDTSYVDDKGDPVKVKVPVEVAMNLAEDVWNYKTAKYRVVATENKTFNGLGAATNDEAKIEYVTVLDDGTFLMDDNNTENDTSDDFEVVTRVDLAEIKLEAYEKNTDALIGLDLLVLEQDNKVLGQASVLGTLAPATVVASYNKDKSLDTDEITVNGALYANVRNSETQFANLKALDTTSDAITTSTFAVTNAVKAPFMALALDHEGDGVVDAIEIVNYKMYQVSATPINVKATSAVPAHVKYTALEDIDGTSKTIYSYDIADAKTLAKDDIFVAAQANGVWYVDAVVAPVEAAATKITTGDNAAITLDGIGAVNYVDGAAYFAGSNETMAFNPVVLLKADAPKQTYYIYNNTVIYSTANVSASFYDLALLLYTEKEIDGGIVNNKLVTTYPAVLLINGEKVTVNLNANDAIDGLSGDTVCADGSTYRVAKAIEDGATTILPYTLVNYVKNEDGTYTLSTAANVNITETVIVPAGKDITKNNNTGIYDIDGYKFELDDNSVIYNIYNSDVADDYYDYLATITKANILNKFDPKATAQETYLLRVEGADTPTPADDMYVLLATVIRDGFEYTAGPANRTYLNDARLIKYAPATATAVMVDGKPYYEYSFLDMATMTNSAAMADTTLEIGAGATNVQAGEFYGWNEVSKKYVAVSLGDSLKANTITKVDANRGIIYFAEDLGENYTQGIKLGADIKVWGTAGTAKNTYKTFDVASLAELLETVRDTTITGAAADKNLECMLGLYTDGDNNTQIAWIVVQNYYVEEVSNVNTLKATADIVK